jgi:hypothetical protein
MKELTSTKWIVVKGILFLLLGLVASLVLVLDNLTWKTVALLSLAVWCFCRFYYFAFYVIEHYVDSGFRFSGLISFLRYSITRRR